MRDEAFGSEALEAKTEVFTAQPEAENNILSGEDERELAGQESFLSDFEDLDSDDNGADESAGVIKVKFNKKKLKFTSKEAVPFVEMGLKWNSFKEDYKKLAMLSNLHSYSVREFIGKLLDSNKALAFKQALENFGGNKEAAELFIQHKFEKVGGEVERNESTSRQAVETSFETGEGISFISEKQAVKASLIGGFEELSLMFPRRFKTFSDVPADMVQDAIENKRSLTDSYLRLNFHELANVKKALNKQKQIQSQSSGSLQGGQVQASELASFEKAFRSALK